MLASHIVCTGRTPNCDNKEILQSDLSGKFLFYQMNCAYIFVCLQCQLDDKGNTKSHYLSRFFPILCCTNLRQSDDVKIFILV